MSYDSLTDEVMRKQAKVCAELRAEVERLRATDKEAKSAFAPWVQGPGIVGGILHLQEEVERLRAEADARAVEELRMQAEGCDKAAANWARELKVATDAGHRDRLESRINQLEGVAHHIRARIAELSKPAAKESEQQHEQESTATAAPSRSPQGEGVEVPSRGQEQGASRPRGIGKPAHPPGARGGESGIVAESQGHRSGEAVSDTTFKCYGVTFTADPKAPRSAVHQALACIKHAFASVTTMVETKPEEPVQDERCGDWPLRDYVAGYNPLTASPLETAVYHLCKTAVRK